MFSGQARYLSVTEAPHNTESLRVGGYETFFLKPECQSEDRARDLKTLQAGSFNQFSQEFPRPRPLTRVRILVRVTIYRRLSSYPKPTIYRKSYENKDPDYDMKNVGRNKNVFQKFPADTRR